MNQLIMMVGLPRSGKSTLARELKHPIVCPDSIRLALHGQPFIGLAEPFVWAIAKVMVRSLFLSGHEQVILDATNVTRERRDAWRSRDWDRVFVEVTTPLAECLQRTDDAGLTAAILRMYDEFEAVDPEECDDQLRREAAANE